MATNNSVDVGLAGQTGTGLFVGQTSPTMSNVSIIGGFLDTNIVTILATPLVASAVNWFSMSNSATGTPVVLLAQGSNTNVSMTIAAQGTGGINIQGYKDGSNAPAGSVGEYIVSTLLSASAVSLVANTPKDVTTISLTAGDWDVVGNVDFQPTGAVETLVAWISVASATIPDPSNYSRTISTTAVNGIGFCVPMLRVSITTTTTVYLSAVSSLTPKVSGTIQARRRR